MNTQDQFLRGAIHSARHGVHAGSHVVEAMHEAVLEGVRRRNPFMRRSPVLTRAIYRAVRAVSAVVGMGGVRLMEWAAALPAEGQGRPVSAWQLHWMTGFNAAWGDFFAEEEHPWAVPMGLVANMDPATFSTGLPGGLPAEPSPHLMVFVHGLGMNELAWRDRQGHGYAERLAAQAGAQALMLRYNTGLPVHDNGERLADKLEQLLSDYPVTVESLTLVGHSMGGLVSLSAGHYGQQKRHHWPSLLQGVACIGSPHQGAVLEVAGNWFTHLLSQTTYSAPLSLIGKRRSAGIKDLRHGSLRPEDWLDRDRDQVEHFHPHPVAAVPGTRYLMIGSTLPRAGNGTLDKTVGDGLVTPGSALKPRLAALDPAQLAHRRLDGISHLAQLTHARVGAALADWLPD
jgi:pimeloyl-ACP methyl ester carboxylesterase